LSVLNRGKLPNVFVKEAPPPLFLGTLPSAKRRYVSKASSIDQLEL